jgi:hypothetical protein
MANDDPSRTVFKSSAERLYKIMNLDEATKVVWTERDLPAMLHHQLAAPLAFDLGSFQLSETDNKTRTGTLHATATARIGTFGELFLNPRPPLSALELAKEFFKARAGMASQRAAEQQLAYLLYLLAVLVARLRFQTSITRLTDTDLLEGIKWASGQTWLDTTTKELFTEARKYLEAQAPS